jgi:hypothetical protein
MTKTTTQAAAVVLAALMTLAVVAGVNGIATKQYSAAERVVMAAATPADIAVQRVVVVGHRAQA